MIIEQIKKFAANRNSSFPGFYSTLLIGPWGMTINFMLKCYKVLFFFWDTYSFSFQTVQCAWAHVDHSPNPPLCLCTGPGASQIKAASLLL